MYNQNDEASSCSEINWFETSMLNTNDWKAKWISDGGKNPELSLENILFRTQGVLIMLQRVGANLCIVV